MNSKFKSIIMCLLTSALLFLSVGCSNAPDVVGEWREIGRTATIEFLKDGSFRAEDNQGMAVSGKYVFLDKENVRFEIEHRGSPPEIVMGKLSVRGDELTILFSRGSAERYRRVKHKE